MSLASGLIAAFAVTIASCIAVVSSDQLYHWFLIPVTVCGIVIGADAVDWIRGRCDLYDPVGILGVYGVHFFYIAPLLHVKWDFFVGDVSPPPDWRDWLGAMAILNAAGLITYQVCRRSRITKLSSGGGTFWQMNLPRLRMVGLPLLAIAAAAQMSIYHRFGGIGGFTDARLTYATAFEGLGWLFMIAESVPILAAFLVISHSLGRKVSWVSIIVGLILLFAIQIIFGGLRGSRSQTVSALIWVAGCIHLLVRPLPRKFVYPGLAFLVVFMYLYGFYKELGREAVNAMYGADEQARLSRRTGRTLQGTLVGDLGRSDIQAFTLYRLWTDGDDFSLALGRTYVGAAAIVIPRRFLPQRPETVVKEGTDIQSGAGSYVPRTWRSTRVYGFAGEAMLNFGPAVVPFAYGVLGFVIGRSSNFIRGLCAYDSRLLLVPFGVFLCITLLAGDSDNVTFGIIKDGFIPALVVLLCSTRRRIAIIRERNHACLRYN